MNLGPAHNPLSTCEGAIIGQTLLGEGLPREAEHHLGEAARSYHLDEIAESHLREAQLLAPSHSAVLIALYRFYFYKGRLAQALDLASRCVAKAARDVGLTEDWRQVKQ